MNTSSDNSLVLMVVFHNSESAFCLYRTVRFLSVFLHFSAYGHPLQSSHSYNSSLHPYWFHLTFFLYKKWNALSLGHLMTPCSSILKLTARNGSSWYFRSLVSFLNIGNFIYFSIPFCSQKTPRGMLPVNQWYLDNANNTWWNSMLNDAVGFKHSWKLDCQ